MHILSEEQIKAKLKTNKKVAESDLSAALDFQKSCDRHISGITWRETIKKIKNLNNDVDIDILKEVASPQTPGLFDKFRKQFLKIFRADGFHRRHIFEAQFKDLETDAANYLDSIQGKGLSKWMQDNWFSLNDERCNDLILIDLPEEPTALPEPFIKIVPLENIYDIKQVDDKVIWVIIENKKKDDQGEFTEYRYIDAEKDAIFIKRGGDVVLKTNEQGQPDIKQNRTGKIPVRRVGGITSSTKTPAYVINQYHKGLLQADKYQGKCNDHDLSAKKHAYPWIVTYPIVCGTCNGKKTVYDAKNDDVKECTGCKGTGRKSFTVKDAAEGVTVQLPQGAGLDEPIPSLPDIAKYVDRDTDTIRLQVELKQETKDEIEESVMGTNGLISRQGTNTATESLIDYQPILDRFFMVSNIAQQVEYWITFTICDIRYNTTVATVNQGVSTFTKRYIDSVIIYGTEYNLKSYNEHMAEYKEGKLAGVPDSELKESLRGGIVARYDNNPNEKERQLLLLELTPFPTYTLSELKGLGIGTSEQLGIKAYFNDIIEIIERETGEPINAFGYDVNKIKEKIREVYAKLTMVEEAEQPQIIEVEQQTQEDEQ